VDHYSAECSGISAERSSLRGTFLRTEMRQPLLDATPILAGGLALPASQLRCILIIEREIYLGR
jgi:hypothetical protein